jgi:hypothetical protein
MGGSVDLDRWNEEEDFDDEFDGKEFCMNCNNTGIVDCHCGGDLCICLNNGEMPCPNCSL